MGNFAKIAHEYRCSHNLPKGEQTYLPSGILLVENSEKNRYIALRLVG
jgi:hypothetical protein